MYLLGSRAMGLHNKPVSSKTHNSLVLLKHLKYMQLDGCNLLQDWFIVSKVVSIIMLDTEHSVRVHHTDCRISYNTCLG